MENPCQWLTACITVNGKHQKQDQLIYYEIKPNLKQFDPKRKIMECRATHKDVISNQDDRTLKRTQSAHTNYGLPVQRSIINCKKKLPINYMPKYKKIKSLSKQPIVNTILSPSLDYYKDTQKSYQQSQQKRCISNCLPINFRSTPQKIKITCKQPQVNVSQLSLRNYYEKTQKVPYSVQQSKGSSKHLSINFRSTPQKVKMNCKQPQVNVSQLSLRNYYENTQTVPYSVQQSKGSSKHLPINFRSTPQKIKITYNQPQVNVSQSPLRNHYENTQTVPYSVQQSKGSSKHLPINFRSTPQKIKITYNQPQVNVSQSPLRNHYENTQKVIFTPQKQHKKIHYRPNHQQYNFKKLQLNFLDLTATSNQSNSQQMNSASTSAIGQFSKRKRLFGQQPTKDSNSFLSVKKITENDRQIQSEFHESQLNISSKISNNEEQQVQIQ